MERIKKSIVLKPVCRKQVCTRVHVQEDQSLFAWHQRLTVLTLLTGWRQLLDGQSPPPVCAVYRDSACPPNPELFLQDQGSENRKSAIMELKGMLVRMPHIGVLRPPLCFWSLSINSATRTRWNTSPCEERRQGGERPGMWRRRSSCGSFRGGGEWWKTTGSPTPRRVRCAVPPPVSLWDSLQ